MAFKDRVSGDLRRVFINNSHFADTHTWNGIPFACVTDDETALKRKNNNVVDISWDNNTTETVVYVKEGEFPGRVMPNEHGFFDNRPMKILQAQTDLGMHTILLVAFEPKAVEDYQCGQQNG